VQHPDRVHDLHYTALAGNASPLTISHSFNALFKVLFIFPSRYLFAIGLSPVFSVGWSLPPVGAAFPNNSTRLLLAITDSAARYGSITLCAALFQETYTPLHPRQAMQPYNSNLAARFPCCASPFSLAVTKGIPVGVFSSAY
jgi:hypothetical protein